jgi:glycine/D-amino acid oxidase-like deaminating enzyme
LKELIRLPYEIVDQNWGIRPTTPDRRPLLGSHPTYENRVILNGFGTKGVSLAPFFSGQLAAWLEGESEITPEVNIRRYKSLYSKFE